ncbi:hypothetical protein ACIGW8_17815 [Streptomyces sioyaensis]|uniref:hypothetical protein n=1 Tax=Streptomyces sioyaensis TaxID=67364 RepID=UPI0037D14DAF
MLFAAPLVGATTPAVAAEDPKTIDQAKVYESENDIVAAMKNWAPVEDSESVMGYPKGVRDEKDTITSVDLDYVKKQYDPKQAVVDAKAAAKKYAALPNTKTALVTAANKIADTTLTEPETRQNTLDDGVRTGSSMYPKWPAPNYCNGKDPDGKPLVDGSEAKPCMFVGKLDTAPESVYPKAGGSTGIAGGGKKTYKVSQQVTDEKSDMAGWSVGGKISGKVTSTPKDGGTGGEAGPEVSFTYSYSSTSTQRNMKQVDDQTEVEFPSDVKGSLQGRRDGAYYVGYIITYYSDKDQGFEDLDEKTLTTIPARVFVQSPKSSTGLTYFKYQEK